MAIPGFILVAILESSLLLKAGMSDLTIYLISGAPSHLWPLNHSERIWVSLDFFQPTMWEPGGLLLLLLLGGIGFRAVSLDPFNVFSFERR